MRATRLGLATLVTALTIVAPAAAQTPEPPPLVNKSFYFECQGATQNGVHLQKVQNALSYTPRWTEVKPQASFTSGAGCGTAETSLLVGTDAPHPLVDAVFGGKWDERVKRLNVELHDLLLGQTVGAVNNGEQVFAVRVLVDGVELTPEPVPVKVQQTVSSTGLSESLKFSIEFKNLLPLAPDGRQFLIGIDGGYLNTHYAYVYGASEVPAGVEFNPTRAAKPTININN